MTRIDGGANAIKGFNYQKAVIALIAINNFKKDDFQIYVENIEDVEVICDGFHTFIQAKNTDLTISKILKIDKTIHSILSKNLSNQTPHATLKNRYKIITPKSRFGKNDRDDLIEIPQRMLLDSNYTYSDAQKEKITRSLLLSNFSDQEISDKLIETYISLTNFENSPEALKMLLGSMCTHAINVDNHMGKVAIDEIFNLIYTKSEIKPCVNNPLNPEKCLDKVLLESIFKNTQSIEAPKTFWNSIKNAFLAKEIINIEKEMKFILLHHKALKDSVTKTLGDFSTDWDSDLNAIHQLYEKTKHLGEKYPIYAILIEVIAEKMTKE